MPRTFLYQQWLQHRLKAFARSAGPVRICGQEIAMPPEQYGAALMQAYFGRTPLKWIAEQAGIPLSRIRRWRRDPLFLLVMDWSKAIFSGDIQEKLILNDYTAAEYHSISAEVSLLEDSLRVMIRMPLYGRFVKLGQRLISYHENDIAPDSYDLRLFRRLLLFFLALEHHWPGPAGNRLKTDFVPLARDVVWPLLGDKDWPGPVMASVQEAAPLSRIRDALGERLRETLRRNR